MFFLEMEVQNINISAMKFTPFGGDIDFKSTPGI